MVINYVAPLVQKGVEEMFKHGLPSLEKMLFEGGGLTLITIPATLYVIKKRSSKKEKIENIKEPDYI